MHPDRRLAKFNRVIHNEGTRREGSDFCCVCSMPCTWRPIRTRILPSSHLDCNVKGAAPFSPFSSPNKSRATLQMLKGLLWHQMGFGVVPSHEGKAVVL